MSDTTGVSRDRSIVSGPDGSVYRVWQDETDGDREINVWRWDGSAWAEVGSGSADQGGISDNEGDSFDAGMAVGPDETLYVAWADDSSGNY